MGGIQRIVKNTSECLIRANKEVIIYSTDSAIRSPRFLVVDGIKLKTYPAMTFEGSYYFPTPRMLSDLLSEKANILHAYNIHALTTLVAYVARRSRAKPSFVVSPFYHGAGHTRLARMLWTPYRPLVRKILKNADGVIVNSKAQRALIERTFSPTSGIFTVYDGIDLRQIENSRPFAFDPDHRLLLYVGRLEKYKNVHVAIAAMKHLPENYQLYIVGNGTFKMYLEELSESLNLKERIHFLGPQPDHVVYRWVKTAHALVHLSAVESFGLTCIESIAAGTPVVANLDGFGLSETVAMYPDYIRAYSVVDEPLSRLVKLIMETAEMKPIKVDVSQFSWDVVAEGVNAVYQQLNYK